MENWREHAALRAQSRVIVRQLNLDLMFRTRHGLARPIARQTRDAIFDLVSISRLARLGVYADHIGRDKRVLHLSCIGHQAANPHWWWGRGMRPSARKAARLRDAHARAARFALRLPAGKFIFD